MSNAETFFVTALVTGGLSLACASGETSDLNAASHTEADLDYFKAHGQFPDHCYSYSSQSHPLTPFFSERGDLPSSHYVPEYRLNTDGKSTNDITRRLESDIRHHMTDSQSLRPWAIGLGIIAAVCIVAFFAELITHPETYNLGK